jgi:hypothetical protein
MNLPVQPVVMKPVGEFLVHGIKPVLVNVLTGGAEVVVAHFDQNNFVVPVTLARFSLNEEEYSLWGADDSYLTELALTKLGFEKR